MKNVFYGFCILFLGICSIYLSQIVFERYYQSKQEIILVQSDLFTNIEYVTLEALLSDKQIDGLFKTQDGIDTPFKIALFYSDLSLIFLKRSKKEKCINKYVDELFHKSNQKWDMLIKRDNSMQFFKNYYLKVYSETLKRRN